jgi:hypothetical protein
VPIRVRKPIRPQPTLIHNEPRFDEAKPVIEEPEDEQYSPPAQPSPPRALFTHEPQEIEAPSNAARFNLDRPKPVQQQPQQQVHRAAPAPQPQRPRAHHFDQDQRPHQKVHNSDDKPKKPVAQILRKYREEHPDGSITWGFENDDGKN